ncbi:Bug family tripartite tricarboxylate transporter substrate binding protein [Paraburkholderia xenovorans]
MSSARTGTEHLRWRAMLAACTVVLGVLGMFTQTDARAEWPEGPIRLVIAFPGGSSEAQARILAKALNTYLGQPIIVQAQPGAGGNIASAYVARARPDGYTILLGSNTFFETNPLVYKDIGYQVADLKPVSMLSEQTYVLAVRPGLGLRTVRELVDFATRNPGKLTNATAGIGSPVALAKLEFEQKTGVRFTDIPYKGGGEDTMAVLGGFADLEFSGVTDVAGNIEAGTLLALGVTSRQRAPRLPNVPSLEEAGLNGYQFTTWNCIFVPAATPAPIVARLHAALVKSIETPEVRAEFEQLGFADVSSTGDAAARRLASEAQTWSALFRSRGIVAK